MPDSSFTQSERLRVTFAERATQIADAERRAELLLGASFLAVAVALAAAGSSGRALSLPLAALYVVGVAAVGEVRLEIGAGFTVPTQAVFVPMLFAVPVSLVPLLVALSLALSVTPAVVKRRVPVSRLLAVPGNSWFAVGPSLVLLLAGDHRPDADWPVLALALAAQFTCDFAANAFRERLRDGISIAELAGEVRQIYLIDLALSSLGLAIAIGAAHRQWVVLLAAPLFGVLGWLAKERRARIDQLIELNDAYHGTALLLGDVVEADDTYTGEHCKDVVQLALGVAREPRSERRARTPCGVRGAAARCRQDRGPERDRQQARQARQA